AARVGAPGAGARAAAVDEAMADSDVVLLSLGPNHRSLAEHALQAGAHVVSTTDDVDQVHALLSLDAEAQERQLCVVVGAGFSPGLTCVLARHAASSFDVVDEVHVAKSGTGGPTCARVHHRALGGMAVDWR